MSRRIMMAFQVAASAACIGLMAPQLVAQGTNPPPPPDSAYHGGHHGPRMDPFKGITLSTAQKSQIDSIRAKYRSSLQDIRSNGDRGQMRQLMQSQWADMRNILSKDQQPTFDDNLKEMKERMRQHMQRGGPPQP